jgi:toxin ParE2
MNLRVVDEALQETERAAQDYDGKKPGLGEDFLQELERTYARIEKVPRAHYQLTIASLGEREFRRAILRRFPYRIIYEVCDTEIVVFAVAHVRRKPNFWLGRTD